MQTRKVAIAHAIVRYIIMSICKSGKNIVMICNARPHVDVIKSEVVKRPNRGLRCEMPSLSSGFGSWIKFLVHLGSSGPVGRSFTTSPRTMHTAIAAGMSEATGRKHILKLALTGSYFKVNPYRERFLRTIKLTQIPHRRCAYCDLG
jgi:hypothetical protein